jgi:hypothetical protein
MTDVLDAAIKNQDAAKAKNAAAQLEPRVDALKNTMEEAAVAALATEFSDTSSALKVCVIACQLFNRLFLIRRFQMLLTSQCRTQTETSSLPQKQQSSPKRAPDLQDLVGSRHLKLEQKKKSRKLINCLQDLKKSLLQSSRLVELFFRLI